MRTVAGRARILTHRLVAGAGLAAGTALLAGLLGGPDGDDVESGAAPEERGYYLTESTLTEMGPDGRPRIVVRARAIEQQLADDSVKLAGLELDYTTQRTGVWHVTADRGRMPPDRGSLLLAGNVRVTGSGPAAAGQAVILTDQLAYDTRANVIQTAEPVAIHFGAHELRGRGMRVVLNDGTLRLESNVNGRFTP
jgi:LPS export ABC transporter protein LptC